MKKLSVLFLCSFCAAAGFFLGKTSNAAKSSLTEAPADTILLVDTVRIASPKPLRTLMGEARITRRLPLVKPEFAGNDSLQSTDSANVMIPIDTTVYHTGNFRAVISGFNARLDSMEIYRNEKIITRNVKPKRWAVSCGIGLTVAPGSVKPGIYVGVGYVLHMF